MRRFLPVAALASLTAAAALAQGTLPPATNVVSLLTYPQFYLGKQVVVRGEVQRAGEQGTVRSGDGTRVLQLISRRTLPDGPLDLKGELWDIGRMRPDDPRAVDYDLQRIVGEGREWPRPGEQLVFAVSTATAAVAAPVATIRSVVLEPDKYEGRAVTLRGQYRARNLFGDVPRAPGLARFDFLIQASGAAIWVTGMRPRGKGFDFELDSKLDTGHWLEVSGTMRHGRGLEWVEATSVKAAEPVKETIAADAGGKPEIVVPPAAPPEVVFSIPTEGETEVPVTTTIRIQTSRVLDPASLAGHVRVGYVAEAQTGRGQPVAGVDCVVSYDAGNRAIELKFTRPLERFRTVRVDLLEGIVATDKQPLKPWTLTFSLGG